MGRRDEETKRRGEEETKRRRDEETKRRGEEETKRRRDEETKRRRDGEKRRRRDGVKRRRRDEGTGRRGDEGTKRRRDEGTGRRGEGEKRGRGDKEHHNIEKMGKEIERKFLVKGPFRHLAVREIKVIQTYLSIDEQKTIRLRISDDKAFLTVKGRAVGNSFSRGEWEFAITVQDCIEMMKLCLPGKIVKTRYLVPCGQHTWEVDVFHDKNDGLIIAELELQSETEKFEKPSWLGDEVTGNPEYYNANLVK